MLTKPTDWQKYYQAEPGPMLEGDVCSALDFSSSLVDVFDFSEAKVHYQR